MISDALWNDGAEPLAEEISWTTVSVARQRFPILNLPVEVGPKRTYFVSAVFKNDRPGLSKVAEAALSPILAFIDSVVRLFDMRALMRGRLSGLIAALDRTDTGIVLLNAAGDLVFANSTARRIIEEGDGLRRSGSKLVASKLSDTVRLQVAIQHVTGRGALTCGRQTPLVTIDRGNGHRPLMVAVVAPEEQCLGQDDVAAMLYVFDPDEDIVPLLQPVCRIYRLSPVESRLVCHLVTGSSIIESAKLMKIKEQTARTYLKQIFVKTETNRQSDLVRLVLSSLVRAASGTDLELL